MDQSQLSYQALQGGSGTESEVREDRNLVTTKASMNWKSQTTRKLWLVAIVMLIAGFIIGVLIGYFGKPSTSCAAESVQDGVFLENVPKTIISEADPDIADLLLNEISAENIRTFHRNLTSSPNLAGTEADLRKARYVESWWKDQGLDEVNVLGYDVLLSYPEKSDPNKVQLIADDGTVIFTSQLAEPSLRPDDIKPEDDVVPPFNSYSPPGDINATKVFYVNYAREEDFFYLTKIRNLSLTDSIVIARYGKIFRANKVHLAAEFGVRAILMYSDPYDYASPTDNTSYPESWWLPPTGVQRGTAKLLDGDPTTPFYPSLDSAFRLEEDDPEAGLPTIPVHPICANDAAEILGLLAGEIVSDDWRGVLTNITYRYGGSWKDGQSLTARAYITTHNERRKVYTVIGFIRGEVEPDRYIVVGNHRDGWVYGALDPLSGTAAMLETSRALRKVMTERNWRPRRSVVFCSWAAEEYGLLGSYEWVEHFSRVIGQRAVAYLNVDILLEGMDSIRFKASPMLHQLAFDATKKVPSPSEAEKAAGRKTCYDTWKHFYPNKDGTNPKPFLIGSGSDYTSFLQVHGIPSLEPRYTWDRNTWRLSSYPTYHSVYETFYLVNNIMDPGFKISRAVTQVWAETLRSMSDSLILPLDAKNFASFIKSESDGILEQYADLFAENNITQDAEYFRAAIDLFVRYTDEFVANLPKINKNNPYAIREVNDKLMNLHRSFLDPLGLPERPTVRNLLSAPSKFNSYAGSVFPSITDALFRIQDDPDQVTRWRNVKKYMSIVTFTVETAGTTLRDSIQFCKGLNAPPTS